MFERKITELMMPKIISKSHGPHVLKTTPAQHRKRRLLESTGVVLAKDPPKVKLEKFHNSRVLKLGEIMRTLVCKGFKVFIVGRVDISSLA